MQLNRKKLLCLVLAMILSIFAVGCSSDTANDAPAEGEAPDGVTVGEDGKLLPLADGFPNKTIILANPFTPDHTEAIHARAMAEAASKYSPVKIISQSLSSGAAAHYQAWADAKNLQGGTEGYQNYTISWSGLMSRILTRESLGYTPEDLANSAIMVSAEEPSLLVVRNDAPWNTYEELLTWAKENPDQLRIAPSNVGSGYHVGMVLLGFESGLPWSAVPTDGQGEANLVMLGGGAEACIANTTGAKSLVEDGKAKVLLQFLNERSELWPDIPCTGELGYSSFPRTIGFCVHPETPASHREWIEELFRLAYNDPIYQEYLMQNAFEPIEITGEDAIQYVKNIDDLIRPIIADLDLLKDELK